MTKRANTTVEVEIDSAYEASMARYEAMPQGHVTDYAIEPSRPERPQQRQTLVLPDRPQANAIITAEETSLIGQTQQTVGQLMQWVNPQQPDTTHTRQVDSAVTVAKASIIASLPMLGAITLITAGLTLLAWLLIGGAGGLWALGWLVLWGCAGLYTLIQNRRMGLYHSSTGIAHHALENQQIEIEEKYATARYAINRTFEFIESQRRLGGDDRGRNHSK